MKYISIVIVIVFIGLVVGFWLKKAPETKNSEVKTEQVAENQSTEPQAENKTAETPKNNGEKKIIKTTMIQGMKIETTKAGNGAEIKNGQTAVMKYTGKLEDGTVFDATEKHGGTPFDFTLGAGMVIKGWDLGVLGMKVGEMRTFTIPSDLAYGPNGIPGVIPGGATLIFDVELVAIK